MKHDARALVGGAAPRSAKEHVVLALLNAQWRGGSTLAEQLLFTTTIQEPFRGGSRTARLAVHAAPDVEHRADPLLGDGVAPRDVRDEEPRAAAVVGARWQQAEEAKREANGAAHGVSPRRAASWKKISACVSSGASSLATELRLFTGRHAALRRHNATPTPQQRAACRPSTRQR